MTPTSNFRSSTANAITSKVQLKANVTATNARRGCARAKSENVVPRMTGTARVVVAGAGDIARLLGPPTTLQHPRARDSGERTSLRGEVRFVDDHRDALVMLESGSR